MPNIKGVFEVTSWDEKAYHEVEGKKLTLAVVSQAFTGDISGTGDARWLMAYRADGTAHFVGLQRVAGDIGGRRGSVVMETVGDFDGKMARWTAVVIDGTADGELDGLRGSGQFGAVHGPEAAYELDLESG